MKRPKSMLYSMVRIINAMSLIIHGCNSSVNKKGYKGYSEKCWGEYGFYDAFSEQDTWYPERYLAIDQGPVVITIENYRTGLLWNLFMSCNEFQSGLKIPGFSTGK